MAATLERKSSLRCVRCRSALEAQRSGHSYLSGSDARLADWDKRLAVRPAKPARRFSSRGWGGRGLDRPRPPRAYACRVGVTLLHQFLHDDAGSPDFSAHGRVADVAHASRAAYRDRQRFFRSDYHVTAAGDIYRRARLGGTLNFYYRKAA